MDWELVMDTVPDVANQGIIAEGLWNVNPTPEAYGSKEQYQEHILEQYKICIEMADRVSARRNATNAFFLTLNTLIMAAIGVAWENGFNIQNKWIVLFPLAAVIALCYLWWAIIRSYKQLNKVKYRVIGEFERHLPTSPFWSGEWKALGEGKRTDIYLELTEIENKIPLVFGLVYLLATMIYLF
jgi:hypothetical protein